MAEQVYVQDLRPDDDGSLNLVPKLTTFEQLQQYFPLEVDRSRGWDAAPPGQPVFKLVGLSVRTGPSFFHRVFKMDGAPFPNVLICAWYPGHDVEPNWQPTPRYKAPAFGDFTNGEGTWGLAVGGLHLYENAETGELAGPLSSWVNSHPELYADAVHNNGWYPGTDHLTATGEWMYVTKPGGTTPPPVTSDVKLVMVVNGVEQDMYIPFQSGVAPSDSVALTLKQGDQQTHHIKWIQGTA